MAASGQHQQLEQDRGELPCWPVRSQSSCSRPQLAPKNGWSTPGTGPGSASGANSAPYLPRASSPRAHDAVTPISTGEGSAAKLGRLGGQPHAASRCARSENLAPGRFGSEAPGRDSRRPSLRAARWGTLVADELLSTNSRAAGVPVGHVAGLAGENTSRCCARPQPAKPVRAGRPPFWSDNRDNAPRRRAPGSPSASSGFGVRRDRAIGAPPAGRSALFDGI